MVEHTIHRAQDHIDTLSMSGVHVIDDFLQVDDLNYLIRYILTQCAHHNIIIKDESITSWIWKRYNDILNEYNISCIDEYVTVTYDKKPVGTHKDKIMNTANNEKYKLIIYLNNVKDGGTIFHVGDKKYLVENKVNRLVIFDINLYHRAQLQHNLEYDTCKMLFGFRGR